MWKQTFLIGLLLVISITYGYESLGKEYYVSIYGNFSNIFKSNNLIFSLNKDKENYYTLIDSYYDGINDHVNIIKINDRIEKNSLYSSFIGGCNNPLESIPNNLLLTNTSIIWLGSKCIYGSGKGYVEVLNKNGQKICEFYTEPDGEFANGKFYNGVLVVGGTADGGKLYFLNPNTCEIYKTINTPGWKVKDFVFLENSDIIVTYRIDFYNRYVYKLGVSRITQNGTVIWTKTIENSKSADFMKVGALYYNPEKKYIVIGASNINGSIYLLSFFTNGTLRYNRTYPFLGHLRDYDISWDGNLIFASDYGLTFYEFEPQTGNLISFFNSSLEYPSEAMEIKKDFYKGCYILAGYYRKNGVWNSILERVCENPKIKVNYSIKGLTVKLTVHGIEKNSTCFWDFGDGQYSRYCNITHVYTTPGDYIITFVSKNKNETYRIEKPIHVRSIINSIDYTKFVLYKDKIKIKINLSESTKTVLKYSNKTYVFHKKNIQIEIEPEGVGKKNITIIVGNEKYELPVLVLSKKQYDLILRIKSSKFTLQKELYSISKDVMNSTFEVADFYVGDLINEKLDEFKGRINEKTSKEIDKFTEKLSKNVREKMRKILKYISERTIDYVFEEVKTKGKEKLEEIMTDIYYRYVLLPGVNIEIDEEKLYQYNETELEKKTSEIEFYVSHIRDTPIYNLSTPIIEFHPSYNEFHENTEYSLENTGILPPWKLYKIIVSDVKSLLTISVLSGFVDPYNLHEQSVIAAIILAIKYYIKASKIITQVSPAINLFGEYSSSYILSHSIIPQIYSGISKSDVDVCYLETEKYSNILHIKTNCKESNILVTFSNNTNVSEFFLDYINKSFYEKNFLTNYTNTKIYIFYGDYIKYSDFENPYNVGLVFENGSLFVKNKNEEPINVSILCNNKILNTVVYNLTKTNCTGLVKLIYEGKEIDEEYVEGLEIPNCELSKLYIDLEEKEEIHCDKNYTMFFISPSGKISIKYGKNVAVIPKEKGTWKIKICSSNECVTKYFVVNKKSKLLYHDGHFENEFGVIVGDVKIFCDNITYFVSDGEFNKTCERFEYSNPFYDTIYFAPKNSGEFLTQNCEKILIEEIPVNGSIKCAKIEKGFRLGGYCENITVKTEKGKIALDENYNIVHDFKLNGSKIIYIVKPQDIKIETNCRGLIIHINTSLNCSLKPSICQTDRCEKGYGKFLVSNEPIVIDPQNEILETNENNNIIQPQNLCVVKAKVRYPIYSVESFSGLTKYKLEESPTRKIYSEISPQYNFTIVVKEASVFSEYKTPFCYFKEIISENIQQNYKGKCDVASIENKTKEILNLIT